MISQAEISAAREALIQMARGRQLHLSIQIDIKPVQAEGRAKRQRKSTRYRQLSLFGDSPTHAK